MPDRRRRTAFRQPLPERTTLLMRERSSSSSSSSSGSSDSAGGPQGDDNPFAPPPEGRPDQPWQPRHPSGDGGGDRPEGGSSSDDKPVWGSQWSSRQPGRANGPFGGRPAGPGGPNGRGGPDGAPAGPRWDPTDPMQRRARYALLSGMWAFFFAIFDFSEIALLLGALATYWAVSALRARPKEPVPGTPGGAAGTPGAAAGAGAGAPGAAGAPAPGPGTGAWGPAAGQGGPAAPNPRAAQRGGRQQTTAAVSGLVTGVVALVIVATTFTVQMVYRDYYTCVNDALTKSGQLACNDLLPKPLEPFFGVKH
ncbi:MULTISPECIES: hypothetical protein [unclassified Streptomyces]|uniref:hypothetical protein n=1 Tax=unclassified Streptomyces TaxID=2593676 RepID=UPI000DAE3E4B|nr:MULTISPECIES: hypothetical protein [unclassified Streptomyces]PZT76214.1 hypothetical protein DNK56_22915 [Streptomyces sp. AC1-42W]PZT79833.1 hypothetical protein DNK55_09775 [Streptomyces sp. AC1-42T]